MGRNQYSYPPEYRARMVELVQAGRTPEELGREFEPTAQSIRSWVRFPREAKRSLFVVAIQCRRFREAKLR